MRKEAEDIHFIHSTLETLVTGLILIIRTVAIWSSFKELKHERKEIEHDDGDLDYNQRNEPLLKVVYAVTALGIFLLIFIIVCFFLFYYLVHLGWTILSNNFAVILITVTTGLVRERMSGEISMITEDHHKAVIYETVLLLTETASTLNPEDRDKVLRKVERFCKALRDTDRFAQPSYISVPDKFKPRWDFVDAMVVSTV